MAQGGVMRITNRFFPMFFVRVVKENVLHTIGSFINISFLFTTVLNTLRVLLCCYSELKEVA